MPQSFSKEVPELWSVVQLNTSMTLFELGREISLKLFENKIQLGNYEEWLFDGECESLYVDFASIRYILVEHVGNNDLPIPGEYIFGIELLPIKHEKDTRSYSNLQWTYADWGPRVDMSAFYAMILYQSNLEHVTITYRDSSGDMITL